MLELQKLAPLTFKASALRLRRKSAFSFSETSSGFLLIGVFQLSTYAFTGASWMGSFRSREFAFAMATAFKVTFRISSFVTTLLAAKPQVPKASTLTPKPKLSDFERFVTRLSRVATNWFSYRLIRTSAYEAPFDFAVSRATSARSLRS